MSDQLAINGGTPVRDVKTSPWPGWPLVSETQWNERIAPAFRDVYLSGIEGLPAPRSAAVALKLARHCGVRYGRLLNHGTDAISAAISSVLNLDGLEMGGEIILPNYTFIATASAPLDRRCTLRFVDCDRRNFTLDPQALDAAIKPGRTRAIIAVHIGGHPADMQRINVVAGKHGIPVIEDCAQSHGARAFGKGTGSLGAIGAFSFQSSKNLTCGEGGAVVTDDEEIDARVVAFQDVGRNPKGRRWEYHRLGWNYRPSEYLAALLDVRLDDLDVQTELRMRNAAYLSRQIELIPGITPPHVEPYVDRHAYHLYCILIDPADFGNRSRDEIATALEAEGIPCTPGYTSPLSEQAAIKYLAGEHPDTIITEPCPNTAYVCDHSIWLYQYVLLADRRDMDDIATALAKVQRCMARA